MAAVLSLGRFRLAQCRSAFQAKFNQQSSRLAAFRIWSVPSAAKRCLCSRASMTSSSLSSSSSNSSSSSSHGDPKSDHNLPPGQLLTLPTILTLARVVAIPVFVVAFFRAESWSYTSIFIGAAVTDWLDGYLARKMKLSSAFGAFLDPVADKLMVATAIVLLCTKPLAVPWFADMPWLLPVPAVVIISREIVVSAVREWAAVQGKDFHKVVAVDKIGKLKTATQMVGLTLLLAFGDARSGLEACLLTAGVGVLYLSAGLALWSLCLYSRRLATKIRSSR